MKHYNEKLCVYLLILFLVSTLAWVPSTYAASTTKTPQTPAPTVAALSVESSIVKNTSVKKLGADYILPYPGILPDHPLYFLKRFRDFILDTLIVDPVRKSEFYILQADKRLTMGVALSDKANAVLSEQVVSRGEKYMQQAVSGLSIVKTGGKDIPGYVIDKLEQALGKHHDVITELISKAKDTQKSGLAESLQLVQKLQSELQKLK